MKVPWCHPFPQAANPYASELQQNAKFESIAKHTPNELILPPLDDAIATWHANLHATQSNSYMWRGRLEWVQKIWVFLCRTSHIHLLPLTIFATKQLLHKWVTAWQELAKRIYGPKQNPHKPWPVAPYNLSSIGPFHPGKLYVSTQPKVASCRQRTDHIHHARAHVEGSCVEKNEATCPPTTFGCSMLYVTIISEWKATKKLCDHLIWKLNLPECPHVEIWCRWRTHP